MEPGFTEFSRFVTEFKWVLPGFFLLLLPGFDGVTETRSIMTGNVGQMAHNWSWEPAGVFSFFFLFCLFSFYCRTIPFIGLSNGSTEFLPSFLFSFGRQEGREAAIVRGGGISISFFGAFFPFFFPLFLFGFFCWRPFFLCVCACVCFVLRAPSLTRPKANGHWALAFTRSTRRNVVRLEREKEEDDDEEEEDDDDDDDDDDDEKRTRKTGRRPADTKSE